VAAINLPHDQRLNDPVFANQSVNSCNASCSNLRGCNGLAKSFHLQLLIRSPLLEPARREDWRPRADSAPSPAECRFRHRGRISDRTSLRNKRPRQKSTRALPVVGFGDQINCPACSAIPRNLASIGLHLVRPIQ
jgi:hypothetical protein